MYEFARRVAGLDFLAVTDRHQPWDVERNKIGREKYEYTVKAAGDANKDGEFIAFPGFEFRCKRGDTAIVMGDAVPYEVVDDSRIKNIGISGHIWGAMTTSRSLISITRAA